MFINTKTKDIFSENFMLICLPVHYVHVYLFCNCNWSSHIQRYSVFIMLWAWRHVVMNVWYSYSVHCFCAIGWTVELGTKIEVLMAVEHSDTEKNLIWFDLIHTNEASFRFDSKVQNGWLCACQNSYMVQLIVYGYLFFVMFHSVLVLSNSALLSLVCITFCVDVSLFLAQSTINEQEKLLDNWRIERAFFTTGIDQN